MSVLLYSVSLLFISLIIAVSFHMQVGLGMMLIAMIGIFTSMLRLAESDQTADDDELDRQIRDSLRHGSR